MIRGGYRCIPNFSATEQPLRTHKEITQELGNKGNDVVNQGSGKADAVQRIMGWLHYQIHVQLVH
jgi:hypothetical protein